MRPTYAIIIALTLAVAALLASGCGNGEGCEGACECVGSECVCPASGDCVVDCIDDCDLQCAGSGNCDFVCGDLCSASCTGSGECLVTVGDDSDVSCTGSGGCEVECHGDCTVACPGSGACTVYCAPGIACDITGCSDSVQSCPEEVLVCGTSCP
jgi:hypothetical protein